MIKLVTDAINTRNEVFNVMMITRLCLILGLAALALPLLVVAQDEGGSAANANGTPMGKENVPNVTVSTFRRTPVLLDFKKLLPTFPGMLIKITKLPSFGSLRSASTNRPISVVGDTTQDNRFVYTPNAGFPADGVRQGRDIIGFDMQLTGSYGSAFVNIDVVLRKLMVRNYTLFSVDNTKPRTVSLNVRDLSGNLLFKNGTKFGEVRIETLPDNGCVVRQFNGDEITVPQTVVSDLELRVKLQPKPDMQVGETCFFKFTAQRTNGFRTRPRVVNMIQRKPFVPRSFNTNSMYTVDVDVSRMVELIGSTQNPGTNVSFVLTKLPSVGQVYDVAETSLDELPDVGILQSQLPYTIYSGPKTRIVLYYKVNPSAASETSSVALEYLVKDDYATSRTATATVRLLKKTSPICGDVVVYPVFWDKPVKEIVLNYTNPSGRQIQKLFSCQSLKIRLATSCTSARPCHRVPRKIHSKWGTTSQTRTNGCRTSSVVIAFVQLAIKRTSSAPKRSAACPVWEQSRSLFCSMMRKS